MICTHHASEIKSSSQSSKMTPAVAPTVQGFGTAGQATVTQLFEILHLRNKQMTLQWKQGVRHFELSGYSSFGDDEITRLINTKPYTYWAPKLSGRTSGGDIIIKLVPISSDEPQCPLVPSTTIPFGVTDKARNLSFYQPYLVQKSVLDVGCGNGRTTARLAKETGLSRLVALEPGSEYDFITAKEYLSIFGIPVENLSLQQAVGSKDYVRSFDVVTVFKYNVPIAQKEEFISALSLSRLLSRTDSTRALD